MLTLRNTSIVIRFEFSDNHQERELYMSSSNNNLISGEIGKSYVITGIIARDEEMEKFLFTLGCYVGETVTTISKLSDTYVVAIKDARYSIDAQLASAILI